MEVFWMEIFGVFSIAVLLGLIVRYFGLPSIIGHVIAGFLMGFSGLIGQHGGDLMESAGSLGVVVLLFLVGLEMNWGEIKRLGKETLLLFLFQSGLLFVIYLVFGKFGLGLETPSLVYFAVALLFSSTIVVVKVLSEKKEMTSFSGRVSIGILVLQDLLAIIALVFLPKTGEESEIVFGKMLINVLFLILLINVFGHFLIQKVMKHVIKSAEDLVLLSLIWFVFCVYLGSEVFSLSREISALLAGISLSTSWGHFQIVSKIKILRDVFLTMFFVFLGFRLGLGQIDWILFISIIVLVMILKFFVTHLISRLVGIGGRNAIVIGLNMTQMSEFSLVVLSIGLNSGLWGDVFVRSVTLAGLISMVVSSLVMQKGEAISYWARKLFKRYFDFKSKNNTRGDFQFSNHVVLIGGSRSGKTIINFLKEQGEKIVLIDFNPRITERQRSDPRYRVIYGDATDPDIIEAAKMSDARLIISTMKNIEDTVSLLKELSDKKIQVPVIADAETHEEAKELYKLGVNYVIFPHFVSGVHLRSVVRKMRKGKNVLADLKEKQEKNMNFVYENEI